VVGKTWATEIAQGVEADFASLVAEAVKNTEFTGNTVSLLLANPQLAQKLVDVPPVKDADLVRIIQREAQQQKFFNDEAAWTFQKTLTVKGVQRVILHLLPKSLLDKLIQGCQQSGLHLISVVPVSAVLHQQLSRLSLNKDDVALIAAETGGYTTVVVGRSDGKLLLVRTLLGDWNQNVERLTVDSKRTIAFITQQYDLNINAGVWLFGAGAEQHAPILQLLLALPVNLSPVEFKPEYWAVQATKLRPGTTPNFIGSEMQHAPQRRMFARVVAAGTLLVLLASLGFAFVLHTLALKTKAETDKLRNHALQLQAQVQDLEQRNHEFLGKEELVKLMSADRNPPVPTWIAGYLSEALPSDLVVTNLHVKWDDNFNLWKLSLAGTLQGTGKPATPLTLSNAVAVLADRLVNGPFHMRIQHRSDQVEPTHGKASASDNWPTRSAAQTQVENQFWIDGVIK
jgi:hypothetical protein